jgi:hypothetical protein
MKKIIELIYYSISEVEISEEVISTILLQARTYNASKNITGCLFFHDKVFLQLLEGEEDKVYNLYNKIKNDKRHSNITVVFEEEIKERKFPQWSMAFHKFDNTNQFIKNIDFLLNDKEKQTKAEDIFWNLAKLIVLT